MLTSGQQSSESLTFPSSVLYRLNDKLLKEKENGKAKRFADRIHQQYLVNLTRGKDVKVTNDDAREIKNYIATLLSGGVDVTKDLDPNANKHYRSVAAAKKKAPFLQDTPAPADLEDGDWEDSQLYAAWAAKYDPEHTVSFTTWIVIHTAWRSRVQTPTERPELTEVVPSSSISFLCRVMPLTPRLELLVQDRREAARQSRLSGSSSQLTQVYHTTRLTHHDFDRLDSWLGDGIINEYMDMLVQTLAPETTVNLGSYFMKMTNANQRGGILRQKGVKLMDMNLALLPLNVAWFVDPLRDLAGTQARQLLQLIQQGDRGGRQASTTVDRQAGWPGI